MVPTIEIYDRGQDGQLTFDLAEVLDFLEPFASSLKWYLIEFEPFLLLGEDGTTEQPPPQWVTSLWQHTKGGGSATALKWQTLMALARHVAQTETILLVATQTESSPQLKKLT